MRKIVLTLVVIVSMFLLTGCSKSQENKFVNVEAKENKIVIDTKDISNKVTFVNYKVDDTTIQFLVVKGSDGKIRIAFNTCNSCNPSPNAYYVQEGDYIVCQNCGNKFHIDEIGEKGVGCNPMVVEEKQINDDSIVLDKNYVESFKEKFKNFNGPTE